MPLLVSSAVLVSVVFALASLWFLFPYAIRKMEAWQLARLCRRHGLIVLSFDDGPSPALTPRVICLLRRLGIRASFFFVGERALEHPHMVKAIAAEGHEVGSHTARHLNAWKSLPINHCRDMIAGQRQIAGLIGETRLFRPPNGKLSLASLAVAKIMRLSFAWWTIDPRDSLEHPRSQEEVLAQIRVAGGGVVLLHDYDRYPDVHHDRYVLQLVEKIAHLAAQEGLRFATFSDLSAQVKDPAGAAKSAIGT